MLNARHHSIPISSASSSSLLFLFVLFFSRHDNRSREKHGKIQRDECGLRPCNIIVNVYFIMSCCVILILLTWSAISFNSYFLYSILILFVHRSSVLSRRRLLCKIEKRKNEFIDTYNESQSKYIWLGRSRWSRIILSPSVKPFNSESFNFLLCSLYLPVAKNACVIERRNVFALTGLCNQQW